MEPLIGAIAAGNTAVLKPSELSASCSSLLAFGIATYLDNKAIKVIEGGPEESHLLLQQKWDKIFFTGQHHHFFHPYFFQILSRVLNSGHDNIAGASLFFFIKNLIRRL